jgi:hypothetical protein
VKHDEPRLDEVSEEEVEPPPIHVREADNDEKRETDEESSEASPATEDQQHPEWTPDTRCLRRKIVQEGNRLSGSSSDSPYALRSRSNRTQSQEDNNESTSKTLRTSENQSAGNSELLREDANTSPTHSYNLRSRTRIS